METGLIYLEDAMTNLGYQFNTHRRRNLNWRITSIRLACRRACGASSWLPIDVGGATGGDATPHSQAWAE